MLTVEDLLAQARRTVVELNVETAHAWTQAVILDVREPAEYQAGAISGAINVPRGLLEFQIGRVARIADRATPLLIYCGSGARSLLAAATLQQLGHTDVRSLAGGFEAWKAAGAPVEIPHA